MTNAATDCADAMRAGHADYVFIAPWFILSAWLLDVHLPGSGVNVANLILVVACLYVSAAAIAFRLRMRSPGVRLQAQDLIYLAYLAVAVSTAIWSPAPIATVMQVIFLTSVWLAVVNLSQADLAATLRVLLILAFATALLSFLVIPLSRELAFQPNASTNIPELRGIFAHQLRLGVFMGMAVGLLSIAALNGELKSLLGNYVTGMIFAAVIIACLIAAFARLYTASMILALGLTIGLSRGGARRWATIGLGTLLVVVAWFARETLVARLATLETDLTLTGRTLIWAKTLAAAGHQNWLGFGYASFDHWTLDNIWGYYRPAHPHNSYVQAYFETGYVGLVLTLLFAGSQLRASLGAARRSGRYSYGLFLVLFTALGSLTGSNYAGKLSMLFCITYLVVSIEARATPPGQSGRTASST